MTKILVLIIFMGLFCVAVSDVSADYSVAEESASLQVKSQDNSFDYRVKSLEDFFEKYNSPLAQYSDEFVAYADIYNLDWRLLPAISGVESTFGKRIPRGSYNAYGWANGAYRFTSWENSIEVVSRALREKYLDRGATNMAKIARRYAASPTWLWRVKYFMEKIEPMPLEFDLEG